MIQKFYQGQKIRIGRQVYRLNITRDINNKFGVCLLHPSNYDADEWMNEENSRLYRNDENIRKAVIKAKEISKIINDQGFVN